MKKVFTMKRAALLCAGLGAVGLAATFAFTGTSALYTSAEAPQQGTIDSGTIVLANDGPSGSSTLSYTLPNFMPGDSVCGDGSGTFTPSAPHDPQPTWNCDVKPSTYFIYYEGSASAFVGLDLNISSTAQKACTDYPANTNVPLTDLVGVGAKCQGTGELPLFYGSASSGMDLMVAPVPTNIGTVELVEPQTIQDAATCKTNASDQVTCSADVPNVLVPYSNPSGYDTATSALIWPGSSSAHPTTIAMSAYAHLDSSVGDQTQGSITTLSLTASAVQSANNTSTFGSGCASGTKAPAYGGYSNPTVPATLPCPASWS